MSSSTAARILGLVALGSSRTAEDQTERLNAQSDEDLLSLVAVGDDRSYSVLFRRFAHLVRGVAVRVIRDRAEAEDLLQDIFLYIYRNSGSFDPEKGSARSWIVQIAHHRALDRRRYLQSRRFYTNEEIDDTITSIADPQGSEPAYHSSLEGVLGRKEARGLFELLSIDQREVIRLAFYEGHTFAEIAELRRQSFGNVRNHYYRGLEKIRRQVFQGKLRGR